MGDRLLEIFERLSNRDKSYEGLSEWLRNIPYDQNWMLREIERLRLLVESQNVEIEYWRHRDPPTINIQLGDKHACRKGPIH